MDTPTTHTTRDMLARLIADVSPATLCSACAATRAGRGLSSVQLAARYLEGVHRFMRQHARCADCGEVRLVLGLAAGPARAELAS